MKKKTTFLLIGLSLLIMACSNRLPSYLRKGIRIEETKGNKEAIDYYSMLLEKDPKLLRAWFRRASCKHEIKDFAGARDDYSKYIELDSGNCYAYYNKALAEQNLDSLDDATRDIKKALELHPGDTIYLYALAYNYYYNGEYTQAINYYTDAIARSKDPAYYNARGVVKFQLKDYRSAIDDYDSALSIDPGFVYALNNRGMAKHEMRLYNYALVDYDKAIKLDPRYGHAYFDRAVTLLALGKKNLSCEDFKKATELGYESAGDSLNKYCK